MTQVLKQQKVMVAHTLAPDGVLVSTVDLHKAAPVVGMFDGMFGAGGGHIETMVFALTPEGTVRDYNDLDLARTTDAGAWEKQHLAMAKKWSQSDPKRRITYGDMVGHDS